MNGAIRVDYRGGIVQMCDHNVQVPADGNFQVAQAVAKPPLLPGSGLHESQKSLLIQIPVKTPQEKRPL